MLLTKDQLQTVYNRNPTMNKERFLDNMVDKGYEIEGIDMNKARQRILDIRKSAPLSEDEQAEFAPKRNIFTKAVDTLFGGVTMAEGLGKGLAADDFYKTTGDAIQKAREQEVKMIKYIKEKEAQGLNTSNLNKALFDLRKSIVDTERTQMAFTESLPSNKAVAGSALRLAGSAAVPSMLSGVSKGVAPAIPGMASRIGSSQAVGAGAGFVQGAKVGALGAGVEGAIHGAGYGMEADKDLGGIAKSTLVGGTVGAGFGGAIGGGMGAYLGNKAAKQQQVDAIRNIIANDPDSSLAKYVIDGGELRSDPLAKAALSQGYTDDAVAMAKGMDDANRKAATRMIDIIDTGKNRPYYRKVNNPADVLGDTIGDYAIKTEKLMKQAGKKVGETAKGLQGKQVMGLDDPIEELLASLQELGVRTKNGKIGFATNSALDGKPQLQKIVNKVLNRASTVSDDAYQVHQLKAYLYDELYGKAASKSGLTRSLEGVFKRFAGQLDGALDNQFPAYRVANDDFRITRGLMDEFYRVAGRNFDNLDEFANMSLGDLGRRLSGNARSRASLMETLYGMDKVVKGAGMTTKGDPIAQAVFLDGLEEMFRKQVVATKGLQGQISGAITGSKLRGKEGLSHLTMDLAADFLERGKNKEAAIKAMRELLEGGGFNATSATSKPGWATRLFSKLGETSADEVVEGATAARRATKATKATASTADDLASKEKVAGVADEATEVAKVADNTVYSKLDNYTPEQADTAVQGILAKKTVNDAGEWVDVPNQEAVVIDADLIKKSNPAYNPKDPAPLHQDSSNLAQEAYKLALAQDESGIVRLTSGGAGSGKSEVIVDTIKNEPGVILDGTLAKQAKAERNIQQALDAGKEVEINVVYPDVKLAYLFNQLRPRSVPDNVFVQTHAGQRSTLANLFDKFQTNENIRWRLFTNSRFGTKGRDFSQGDIGKAIKYQSKVNVEEEVMKAKETIANLGVKDLDRLGALLTYMD